MIDFLRNLTKSAEEKRLERLNAYLDGELSPRELEQFEQELARDNELEAEVEALRQVQMSMRQLPQMKAPRNYMLDPAVYARPVAQPARQLYPALRLATALTAFFFVLTVALDLLTPVGALEESIAMMTGPQEAQLEEAAGEAAPAAQTDTFSDTPPAIMMEEAAEDETAEGAVEEPAAERTTEEVPQEPEVAADSAEEEAVDEAEEMVEEAAQTEEAAPDMAAPEATAIMDSDATLADEPDTAAEAADSALNTAEANEVEALEAPQEEEVEDLALPTPADGADDSAVSSTATEDEPQPFPWLLLAEVLLGVTLVGLLVMLLMARRRRSEIG